MKHITIFACLLLMISMVCAQIDCKPYVPTSKGTTWEITNYSSKDKETGKVAYELLDKVESGNDLTFSIQAVSYDKKGNLTYTNTYEAWCKNGKFEFDMAFFLNGESMQAYENMDIKVDATEFEMPSLDAPAGTTMEDGQLVVDIASGSVPMFTMTVLVTDRKVEAREAIETSAGNYDCIKLSQKVSTKMLFSIEATSKEWYAEEVGLVRSESYDKKGKLTGYSMLTKFDGK